MNPSSKAEKKLKPCKEYQTRDPVTNRCKNNPDYKRPPPVRQPTVRPGSLSSQYQKKPPASLPPPVRRTKSPDPEEKEILKELKEIKPHLFATAKEKEISLDFISKKKEQFKKDKVFKESIEDFFGSAEQFLADNPDYKPRDAFRPTGMRQYDPSKPENFVRKVYFGDRGEDLKDHYLFRMWQDDRKRFGEK